MSGRNPFSESSVPLQNHGEPPPYSATEEKVAAPSKWNPKSWGLKTKIAVAVGIVAVIIAIICGAYFGVRNNKYPNYSKLNYSLSKTCKAPLLPCFPSCSRWLWELCCLDVLWWNLWMRAAPIRCFGLPIRDDDEC